MTTNSVITCELFQKGVTDAESIKLREQKSPRETVSEYDDWAKNGTYEKDVAKLRYRGPQITAKAVAKVFQTNRENIRIVDMAAGTGLLALELSKYGFKYFDGVDPSFHSKETAMKLNVYGRYILDFIGNGQLNIHADEYDCCVSSGGFGPGLMPCIAIREFIRVVKPGGYICMTMPEYIFRLSEEHRDRFEALMRDYENQGLWKKVSKEVVNNYFDDKPGVVFVFKVLKSES